MRLVPRFRLPRFRASRRRLVVISAVVALVAGVGVSSASAATPDPKTISECAGQTPPITNAQQILCLQILARISAGDYSSRDMQVAAPSSVIAATSSETPEQRVQQVNRWRPNSQAFIDAKARLAQSTGLTAQQLDAVGRWAPRVTRGLGVASVLSGDSLLATVVRDGVLYPQLEGLVDDPRSTTRNTYCVRHGNFATDWLTGFVVDGCPEWRINQNFQTLLKGALSLNSTKGACLDGVCIRAVKVYKLSTEKLKNGGGPSYGDALRQWHVCLSPLEGGSIIQGNSMLLRGGASPNFGGDSYSGTGSPGSVYCPPGSRWFAYVAQTESSVLTSLKTTIRPDAGGDTVVSDELFESTPDSAEWLTRVRCLDGSFRFSVSESFQQEKLGAVPVPKSVALSGCQPVGVDVGVQRAGRGAPSSGGGGGWSSVPTSDGAPVSVGTSEVPTEVQDWQTNFPNCWDGSCLLELRKVIGGTMELDCFDAPEQCLNWSTEVQANPDTYRCYYGGSLVAIAECNVYTRVFDRDKVQQGTGYADPATGTGVTTSTGTAVTTNPGAASTAMSTPVADPASNRQCFPSGWGAFNPFEWVLQPVKCALEWAFVPRATKLQQVQTRIQLATTNSVPATFVTGLQSWGTVLPVGGGCMGPPLDLNIAGFSYTGHPLQACSGPLATAADWSRIILTILAIITGLIAITRYVGRVFGFGGIGEGGTP